MFIVSENIRSIMRHIDRKNEYKYREDISSNVDYFCCDRKDGSGLTIHERDVNAYVVFYHDATGIILNSETYQIENGTAVLHPAEPFACHPDKISVRKTLKTDNNKPFIRRKGS